MKTNPLSVPSLRRLAQAALVAVLVGGCTAIAQDDWYDPTDWFDATILETDPTNDYLSDDYGYDYDLSDAYDYGSDWTNFDTWSDVWEAEVEDTESDRDDAFFNDFELINEDLGKHYPYENSSPRPGEQSNSADPSHAESRNTESQHSAAQTGRSPARLSGTVEGLRRIRLEQASGATGTYTIANIRLENGKYAVANLGRPSRLDRANLSEGESIEALGRRGAIAGKTIFVAEKLKIGGETIDANPIIRLSNRIAAQKQSTKTITGTVADITQSTSRADNNHTLLNLRLENGRSTTVDFGPGASLEQIGLQEGEKVTVRGHTARTEGREVLIPHLMKIEGQKLSASAE